MRLEVDTSVWPDFFMSVAWYEFERRGLGADLLEEAAATVERIELNPLAYPCVRNRIRRAQLHRFPFGMFYEIVDGVAIVYAIVHLGRDEKAWLKNFR